MVSVKQHEGDFYFVKSNASSEQSKCHQVPPRGVKTHVYCYGSTSKGNSAMVEEEQSLLDALLLSQWEDCSWKGKLNYDITMCETQIIRGGKKLIAQMNEKWNANFLPEFEKSVFPLSGKPSYIEIASENLFLCVANGQKDSSEIVVSTVLPKDGILVMVNVNPVEYGHVFLVPYGIRQRQQFPERKMLYSVTRFAKEINNYSFRVFFDHSASTNSGHVYFQAGYFANSFPVELLPTVPIYGCMDNEGVNISELADYPLKALVFKSQNLEPLVGVVSDICCYFLQNHNIVISLLISECGTKILLFPQVNLKTAKGYLFSWECGGYFVYTTQSEFDSASEEELSERLASASLNDKGFEDLKQLCCNIAAQNAL